MDKFINYAEKNVVRINKEISEILNKLQEDVDNRVEILSSIFREFVKANNGGKRIRANLAVLSYQLFGGKDLKEMIRVSVSLEIWQTGVLAQDDIIDNSPTRRQMPSLYFALGGTDHAKAQAMCLGDFGMGYITNDIILNSHFRSEQKLKALQCLNNTYNGNTLLGQMLDIEFPYMIDVKQDDVLKMYKLKTANYTIIGPMQVGAILAGASKKELELIEEFGRIIGTVFQIQDDILGIFGTEKAIGKPVTSDVAEGKKTILSLWAFSKANKKELEVLKSLYGVEKRTITYDDTEKIKEIFVNTGALKNANEFVGDYSKQANTLIKQFPDNQFRIVLESFVEYMLRFSEKGITLPTETD